MGNLKSAFDAVRYAILILLILFTASMFLGVQFMFGNLFSTAGFVVLCFLVFSLVAE